MGLNAAGYHRSYGDLATIREILRKTITSSLQYQCFTERQCMEVLTLLAQVICTLYIFTCTQLYSSPQALWNCCTTVDGSTVYIKGINDMPPLLTSSGKHCAVVFLLRLLPRRFQTVHDHIRMPSGGSIPRHPVPKKEPKRGRLQCISRGFHPLDIWTVIFSDSPWTANRRSRKKTPDSS